MPPRHDFDSSCTERGPIGPLAEADMLRAIFDMLPATINCKDSSGRYVFMNTHQAKQLGIEPEEAVGKTTAELFGSDWGEIVRRQDVQVLLSGSVLGPYREDYNSLGCKEVTGSRTSFQSMCRERHRHDVSRRSRLTSRNSTKRNSAWRYSPIPMLSRVFSIDAGLIVTSGNWRRALLQSAGKQRPGAGVDLRGFCL